MAQNSEIDEDEDLDSVGSVEEKWENDRGFEEGEIEDDKMEDDCTLPSHDDVSHPKNSKGMF